MLRCRRALRRGAIQPCAAGAAAAITGGVVTPQAFPDMTKSEVLARLAAIVDSSGDAIIGKTLDGVITTWNPGAEKIFGYTAAEAIGRRMVMLFPPERVAEEAGLLARIARGERVEHFETVRVRQDGSRIAVSVAISPIKDAQGKIIGASTIARDISERTQFEDRMLSTVSELRDVKAALDEHSIVAITDDFAKSHPMLRLLEGAGGSGKTAVAAASAYLVATSSTAGRTGALQVAYL